MSATIVESAMDMSMSIAGGGAPYTNGNTGTSSSTSSETQVFKPTMEPTPKLRVRIGFWNTGKGTEEDLAGLMLQCDVIALAEASDREDLKRYARNHGWHVIESDLPGGAATPLLVAPENSIAFEVAEEMLASQFVGRGAGPDHNKQKNLTGAKVIARTKLTPHWRTQKYGVLVTHLLASVWNPVRKVKNRIIVNRIVTVMEDHKKPGWFIVMDGNATPNSWTLKPLYKAGWTNTHKAGHAIPTHGKRTIDYIWFRVEAGVKFIRHYTIETKSDHRAIIGVFELSR